MRYFLLIIINLSLLGCYYMDFEETLHVKLPGSDKQIFKDHHYNWVLEYRDREGRIQQLTIDADVEELLLTVSRGKPQAFLLFGELHTVTGESFFTKPAGFIYLYDKRGGRMSSFQWEIGFESFLFYHLEEYINLENLNIKRLLETISSVSKGDTHWIINGLLIEEQILAGDFNIYDVRKLRKREIGIYLPAGEWFSSNLLESNIVSASISSESLLEVPTGFSCYLHKSGLRLEIEMKENGTFEYIVY